MSFNRVEKFTSPAALRALLDAKTFNAESSAAIHAKNETDPDVSVIPATQEIHRLSKRRLEQWKSTPVELPVEFQKSKLQLGPAAVDNVDLAVDSGGIKLKCDANLAGKLQPYQAKFPKVTANIHVDDRTLAQFYLKNLDLKLNNFDFKLDAGLVPTINEADLPGVLESLGRVLSGSEVPVKAGINGINLQLPSGVTYRWMKLIIGEIEVCDFRY
jgi:hypothetical protein